MKLKVEITLDPLALRRWKRYRAAHTFLRPTDDQLIAGLVWAGLEAWSEHHRNKVDKRGIQSGRHDK